MDAKNSSQNSTSRYELCYELRLRGEGGVGGGYREMKTKAVHISEFCDWVFGLGNSRPKPKITKNYSAS